MEKVDLIFKVIVIGEPTVGKTSLLHQFQSETFSGPYVATIGVEFFVKKVLVDKNTPLTLQIWDTAGDHSFQSMVKQFFRQSAAVFLIYNILQKSSLVALKGWLEQGRQNSHQDVVVVLVGNKIDSADRRQVSYEDGVEFMNENNIDLFFETSAVNGHNVKIAFEEAAKRIFLKYLSNESYRVSIKSQRINPQPIQQKSVTQVQINQIEERAQIDHNNTESFHLSSNGVQKPLQTKRNKNCC